MKALSHRRKKLWPMLKFFSKVGHRSLSRSHVQNLWLHRKGLVIRYTHAKYESPISYNKKVMANVKVFFKSRSKVTVKVTSSKFMVLLERSCHKNHTCQI